ncbi:MAG: hypothetical protein KBA79_05825 [Candidatus Cloacimonetes bacterium]|nr:hypothetical protein [Candidatus Cloacimonadota bacterium]HNZ06453.1 hypothetical protein [Candidatus Cloacimonadota bacterium]HOH78124.1 hypothetical protein [Candidatus Cloacimonadota bacterium]HPN40800.1 hypothetical protein [Candidatus Cloacimonadota bacterium]
MNYKKHPYDDVHTQIDPAEAAEMIEKVARFIAERHFAAAGIMLVESLRPLHSIGSQALFFILPFAEILFDSRKYQQFALMIQNEDNLKKLVARMDELDEEINRERRIAAKLKRKRRRAKTRQFIHKIFKIKDNKAE